MSETVDDTVNDTINDSQEPKYVPFHTPVLLNEVLENLAPEEESSLFIDGTTGEGGHAFAILSRWTKLNYWALDADERIQAKAKVRLASFGDRVKFHLGWFDEFFENYPGDRKPDRILLDLGISMFHYEGSGRGFSFRLAESLDMRLNPEEGQSAADLVNRLEEKDLADLIYKYGEERLSRRIARAVVLRRKEKNFVNADDLAQVIYSCVPAEVRRMRIHPATKTFQALRIAVNHELDRLEAVIPAAFKQLKVGGALGIITFHSLEDRIVKNIFRDLASRCVCPKEQMRCNCGGVALAKVTKAIGPTDEESRENPPSRSAKLRVAIKIREDRKSE